MTQVVGDTQQYRSKWQEGQISRSGPVDDWSYVNEDASAIKIGYAVIKGTDPLRQAKKPVAAGCDGMPVSRLSSWQELPPTIVTKV